jgi:hypothetical protein
MKAFPIPQSGPWLAFDALWFATHQRGLLWLLNAQVVRVWFRWILRIHKDVPAACLINQITPHSVTFARRLIFDRWMQAQWQMRSSFRVHPKFSKRVYLAFRPLWWTLHFWDWLIADRFIPQWSFGFLSLTVYPAAGAASPVDGIVQRAVAQELFSSIRGGAGTGTEVTSGYLYPTLSAGSATDQFTALIRAIACFDTSVMGTGAGISAATFSMVAVTSSNGLGGDNFHVCGATPASTGNLVTGDYSQLGNTSFGSVTYASLSAFAYSVWALDSNGIANIDPAGISKFGVRLGWDINNSFTGTWSNGAVTYCYFQSADASGTAGDPKLDLTYTAGLTETYPAGYRTNRQSTITRM